MGTLGRVSFLLFQGSPPPETIIKLNNLIKMWIQ